MNQNAINIIKEIELSPLSCHYQLTFYHDDSGIVCCSPSGKLLNISEFAGLFSTLLNNYSHNHLPNPTMRQTTSNVIEEYIPHKTKQCPGVYIIQSGDYYKIGCSGNIPKRTEKIIAGLKPYDARVIIIIETEDYHKLEKELHQKFKDKRIKGEWFTLNDHDISYIEGL